MIKTLKRFAALLAFSIFAVAPALAVALPQTALAQPSQPSDCESRILGMPPWFRGLVKVEGGECIIMSPNEINPDSPADFIWRIALNVIEIGLFIAGYVALFFIIYGGFQFLTGGSNPGQIEKARMTILNAVIGLAISLASIAITNFIFNILG